MPNKLIVDASPFYTRCAVLLDGELHEIHVMPKGDESVEGNIYVGRVETISKGIDAAFVNIGQKNNAFLFIDDTNGMKKLKCGQPVIVQALRDATKGKGVYITTNISFAGTYCVLFPDGHNAHVGVSAKITDKEERKRLIELIRPHVPKGSSAVIRTSAKGKNKEIIKDLKQLIHKMNAILEFADTVRPPALIHEEKHFVERIIRDTLCYNIEEVVVNGEYMRGRLDSFARSMKIQLSEHSAGSLPFDYYSIEGKLRDILHRKVWLRSGGFLIIDETEALVAIDVNTGKSKKRESTGETIYYSNLEAAREIPRQLRLRNLSGIVVIDFIDMKSEEKRRDVLAALTEECRKDRNKTTVVGFTDLGLALITRKKTREPITRTLLSSCKCIGGRRYSERYIAFNIYLKIKRMLISSGSRFVSVAASKEIIECFKEGVLELEAEYGAKIVMTEKGFARYGEYEITHEGAGSALCQG